MKNWVLAVLTFFSFACTKQKPETTPEHKAGIEWYKGSVESAFAQAKASGKPMFLYWGAIWCPPCNQVKATIFPHPDFVKASQSFINIYLDGDTEEAQKWGEKLNASGYPTLMVLNSSGEEVSRLNYSLDPTETVQALNEAFQQSDTIDKLTEKVLAQIKSKQAVDPSSWRQLANYEWVASPKFEQNKKQQTLLLEQLSTAVPENLTREKNLLFVKLQQARIASLDEGKKQKLTAAQLVDIKNFLDKVVSPEFALAENLELVAYDLDPMLSAVYPEADKKVQGERVTWIQKLREKNDAIDPKKLDFERRLTWFSIYLSFLDKEGKPQLTQEKKEKLKNYILTEWQQVKGDYQRTAWGSSIAYALHEMGFIADAHALLDAEIPKAKAPFYIMRAKAGLYGKEKNKQAVLEWSKKAYEASVGSTSRLEWGSSYLKNLFETKTKDVALIDESLRKYWAEVFQSQNAFYGRGKRALERTAKSLADWKKSEKIKATAFNKLVQDMKKSCSEAKSDLGPDFKTRCQEYFRSI